MADPFDVTAGNDPWRNLMQFGLATMAAGSEPGARTLGSLGKGGLAAMESAKQNALARAQMQYTGANIQTQQLQNMLALNQVNAWRQLSGQPPLSGPAGSAGLGDAGKAQPIAGVGVGQNAPGQSTGMPFSPTAGMSIQQGSDNTISKPSEMGANSGSSNFSIRPEVMQGGVVPNRQEATQLANIYAQAGNNEMAGKYMDIANAGIIAGQQEWAKVAPQLALKNQEPYDLPVGATRFQGGMPVAQGAIDATTPQGTPYRIPAQAVSNQDKNAPLGIRNNNPGNLRPTSDKWQGATGENSGYITFDAPESGIRAMSMNLRNYGAKGINTPLAIAERWAPKGDGNDPAKYGASIAKNLGIDPNQQLNLDDPAMNYMVTAALIQGENGTIPYHPEQIANGVRGAFMPQQPGGGMQPPQANGLPAWAIQTGISPGQKSYEEGRGGELSKRMAEIDDQAEGAKQANFLLTQMQVDSSDFVPGKFADARGELGKYIRTVNPDYNGSVAAYERFVKNAITLTNEEVRQVSSRAAVQEYKAIQGAQPQPEMSPLGIKKILDQKFSINDYKLAKQTARDSWLQSHNNSPEGFETDFNKNISPAVFLVARMSEDELRDMYAKIKKQENGDKVLANLQKKILYAHQNGLME